MTTSTNITSRTELRLRVVVETGDERTEYTVLTDNRDRVAFELLQAKNRWPAFTDAMFLGLAVFAWSALKRSGVKPYPTVADFVDHCPVVEPVDEDGNALADDQLDQAEVEVPPTTGEATTI